MTELTNTQMSVLSSACARADGIASRPETLNRTAAVKVAAKLLNQNLLQEVPAKLGWPIWRMDDEGRAFSLKILKAGRAIVQPAGSHRKARNDEDEATQPEPRDQAFQSEAVAPVDGMGRTTRKRDVVVALLQRDCGASIDDLMAVTGWLPHSTRAALTGLRKAGLPVERSRNPGSQVSVYRIAPSGAAAAA
jgi:hypothetical protein